MLLCWCCSVAKSCLFVISWTTAGQGSLTFTISLSLSKLMSIESVMSSNQVIFCCCFSSCLQSFPESGSFQIGQSIGASASASVLPINIQDRFPLGWTGWISLLSKALWSPCVFSKTTVQMHQFFAAQLSLLSNSHIHTWLLEKP